MAWCPKCKNEYREGITVCAECGCELVGEEQIIKRVPIVYGDEKHMVILAKYLEYNDFKNVAVVYDQKQKLNFLLVNEEDKEKATKLAKVFVEQKTKEEMMQRQMQMQQMQQQMMQQQMMQQQMQKQAAGEVKQESGVETSTQENVQGEQTGDNTATAEDNSGRVSVPAGAYLDSAKKAEDNRSSAWTLLLVGGLGMLFLILGITGVLPFKVGNPYMFYGVMSAIFILFIVMGFVSMKNAKFFAKNAESETNLKNTLLDWCRENLKAEEIDAKVNTGEIGYEELCLRRYEFIKYRINHQFMNLDQGFLDRLIDDEVYEMVFPSEE